MIQQVHDVAWYAVGYMHACGSAFEFGGFGRICLCLQELLCGDSKAVQWWWRENWQWPLILASVTVSSKDKLTKKTTESLPIRMHDIEVVTRLFLNLSRLKGESCLRVKPISIYMQISQGLVWCTGQIVSWAPTIEAACNGKVADKNGIIFIWGSGVSAQRHWFES